MSTENVTVTVGSNLLPLRNLHVMYLRVSNFRCRYLHAVSTSPLHNTYTLRSCASHYRGRRQEPPVYSTLSRRQASYVFARDIDLSFLPKLNSHDRTMNITACIMRVPLPCPFLLIRGRFLRSLPVSLCLSSVTHVVVFGPQVEREQIRYPLTSTSKFGILIAANSTAVCSRVAQLTRVLSALQRCLSRGMFPAREAKLC